MRPFAPASEPMLGVKDKTPKIRLHANGDNHIEWQRMIHAKLSSTFGLPAFDETEGHHLVKLQAVDPSSTVGLTLVAKLDASIRPADPAAFKRYIVQLVKDEAKAAQPPTAGNTTVTFESDKWEMDQKEQTLIRSWKETLYNHAMQTDESHRRGILTPAAFQAFEYILGTLPEEMIGKISAKGGDVPGLRTDINIILNRLENFSAPELMIKFMNASMSTEGGGNLMKYLSVMKSLKRRLDRVNNAPGQELSALVLLRGLDSVAFRYFIDKEESTMPRCPNFEEMEQRILRWAASKVGLESVAAATKMTNSAHAYVMEQKTNKPNNNNTNRRLQSQDGPRADERLLEMCRACSVCIQWATKSKCLKVPTCKYMHKWPSVQNSPRESSSKSRQTPTPYREKKQGIHTLEDLDPALFLLDDAEGEQDTHWSNAETQQPSDQEQESQNEEYEFNMLQHFEAPPDLLDSEDEDARPDAANSTPLPILRDRPTAQTLLRKVLLAKEALVYGMAAAASIKCQVHTPTLIMDLPLDQSLLPPGATTWLDKGVFKCELCSAALHTAYAWYQHVRGQRHQRTQEHFMMGSVSPYYYCTQCDSVSAHEEDHESGKRHRKRLAARHNTSTPVSSTTRAGASGSTQTSAHAEMTIQYASEAGGEILSRLDAIIREEFTRLRERILATVFNHFEEKSGDEPEEEIHALTLDGSDSTNTHNIADQWVFDTGATICATNDARDCYDIAETHCRIRQAGKDMFTVKLKGRLRLNCDRSAFGLPPFEVSNQLGWCLISPMFSRKIVAAAPLLRAGWTMQGSAEEAVLFLPDGTPAMTARPSPVLLIIQLAPHQLLTLTKALRPTRRDLVARILIGHLALAHISYQEVARILKLQLPPDLPAYDHIGSSRSTEMVEI